MRSYRDTLTIQKEGALDTRTTISMPSSAANESLLSSATAQGGTSKTGGDSDSFTHENIIDEHRMSIEFRRLADIGPACEGSAVA